MRVLDLCCGQGRHSLELARRGFREVLGIDRSAYLVRLARRRAKKLELPVRFREGDARQIRIHEACFDAVIMMGNSFGYFESADDDARVLVTVKRALRSGGKLLLDLADGEWLRQHFEPRSWEWIGKTHFVCRERSLSADSSRLISREVVVDGENGVIADQFYAERLYSRAGIIELLERCGFLEVEIHTEYATQSERNQDLGMMARRIFVTAKAPEREQKTRPSQVPFPEVTVLLGDPRLPDTVKKGGQFNPEDLETVARLKAALSELTAYQFSYVDEHASMLPALRQRPPKFVLNLCDEGYANKAELELHLPAYLDIIGVPYSGSHPTCLALCYNKSFVRAVAQSLDVPVPAETYLAPDDMAGTIASVLPALIKPAQGDGSIGITRTAVVETPDEALHHIEYLRQLLPGSPILVQEFLGGTEFSVGIIGNPGVGYQVLPILEVDYSGLPADLPRILSYESKWVPESPYWNTIQYRSCTADESVQRLLTDYAKRLFERLECRDYARFDFRMSVDSDEVKLLDVNANPGWCWDGKLAMMASFAGYRYAEMLRMIIETAQARIIAKRPNG
jgi:D-alanine-D-alanine ligase